MAAAKAVQRPERVEEVGGGIRICVSDDHTFSTDSFLLSYFAAPHPRDLVCDLCTGCGIVPLLWHRDPAARAGGQTYAIDIQPRAVRQMEETVRLSGVSGFTPILGDLRALDKNLPLGQFHLVTCNPPYKAEGTGLLSESSAGQAARHELFCTLEDVAAAAEKLLRFGGRLCLCQLPERLPDVLEAMRRHRIEPKRIRFAQARIDKAPWLVLVEGKLGAKPFLQVEAPLLMTIDGAQSPEAEAIYGRFGRKQREN